MNPKKTMLSIAVLALFAALPIRAAQAQDLTGTMKKIKETGAINIGHRESSIPFSYLDDKQQPIGYAMDLCMKVVEAVKAELKMPNLKLNLQPVTSSNRIPLLKNGTIDMECGSTTNSVKRQEEVAFGPTYFVINVTAAVRRSSAVQSIADFNGKTVSTTSGTTAVPLIKQYEKAKSADVKEIYGKDHAESFLLLAEDRLPRLSWTTSCWPAKSPIRRARLTIGSCPSRCARSRTASCCARTMPNSRRWSTRPSGPS